MFWSGGNRSNTSSATSRRPGQLTHVASWATRKRNGACLPLREMITPGRAASPFAPPNSPSSTPRSFELMAYKDGDHWRVQLFGYCQLREQATVYNSLPAGAHSHRPKLPHAGQPLSVPIRRTQASGSRPASCQTSTRGWTEYASRP